MIVPLRRTPPRKLRSLGNGDRKAADITEGQDVDYDLLAGVLAKTSSKL